MKTDIMSDALDDLNEDIIEQTARLRETKRGRKNTRLAWAAALVFAAGLAAVSLAIAGRNNKDMKQADTHPTAAPIEAQATRAPEAEVGTDEHISHIDAEMIPFFIYHGREYLHYTMLDGELGADSLGEKLGTAVMKIDEWSEPEAYAELSGSVGGDFYEIKGYDPDFVLALSYLGGGWSPFVAGKGLDLAYGRELIEDRLHVSEHLADITYEPAASWNWSMGEVYRLPMDTPEVTALIEAADAAEIMSLEDVKKAENLSESALYNNTVYQLYLGLEGGLTARLRLIEGGYILFDLGSTADAAIVRVPQETFNALISLMESKAGTPLYEVDPLEAALAECEGDPTLGSCIPSFVPAAVRPVSAELVKYEDEAEPAYLTIRYTSREKNGPYYFVWISKNLSHGSEYIVTPETLSVERLDKLTRHNIYEGREYLELEAVLLVDGVSVQLYAVDIDAETAYAILSSVRGATP